MTPEEWKQYKSFADLTVEEQNKILAETPDLKQDPKDPNMLSFYIPVTEEWFTVPKAELRSTKWGLKTT